MQNAFVIELPYLNQPLFSRLLTFLEVVLFVTNELCLLHQSDKKDFAAIFRAVG